jgi:Tfp pilus assembly protein PilX
MRAPCEPLDTRRHPTPKRRRGFAVLAVVVVLAVVHLAVMGSVAASGNESVVGAMRVESTRAFYAAESGATIALRLTNRRLALPAPGTSVSLGVSAVRVVSAPPTGEAGEVVVIGASGEGQRKVRVTLAPP